MKRAFRFEDRPGRSCSGPPVASHERLEDGVEVPRAVDVGGPQGGDKRSRAAEVTVCDVLLDRRRTCHWTPRWRIFIELGNRTILVLHWPVSSQDRRGAQ